MWCLVLLCKLYKSFIIDLQLVGVCDYGWLLCKDACPVSAATRWMLSIMLGKQGIFTIAFAKGGFLSPTPLICVCLEGFGPVVPSSGPSGFLVLSFFHPSLLFLLPSASRAETSGGMMSLRKESVNTCPACQAKYLSLGVPPSLPPPLLLPPLPPDP